PHLQYPRPMPRALPRLLPLALLALLTSCEGCLDGMDVSRLTAAFVVEPGAIERLQVWAGYPRTVTLRVKSQGAAPLLDLTASVRDAGGPAQVTARLDGDALAPGGELALFVVL